jgi:hypothetical protein
MGYFIFMAKDTFYFSHDYNSRNDEKIKFLLRKHGLIGYGLFWAIIEDLYNNANALQSDYEGIAYDYRINADVVKSIINDFDLFVFDGETFGSLSVQKRIDERDSKSVKARESAHKRWTNANAMQTQCDSNAIKESKGKEIKEKKVNKVKETKETVVMPFESIKFIKYWGIWLEYKKEQYNFTYKSVAMKQAALNDLVKLSKGLEENAIKIIEQSLAKGWKGFFELKTESNATTNNYSKSAPKITDEQLHEAFIKRSSTW